MRRRLSRHAAGDIIHTTRRGVTIRYSPSMGTTTRYRVECPHGNGCNDRTLADARGDARHPGEFCSECRRLSP